MYSTFLRTIGVLAVSALCLSAQDANRDAVANPQALDYFAEYARAQKDY